MTGKCCLHSLQIICVLESLECSVPREMKKDENGDNFTVAHLKSAISPLFSVFAYRFFLELRFYLLTEFVDRIKDFRYLCSVISVYMKSQLFVFQL